MTRSRINPNWVKDREEEIRTNIFKSCVLSYNPAAQWLITHLANNDIPVVVTNLGAGVKRIALAEKVCSKCKGSGKET